MDLKFYDKFVDRFHDLAKVTSPAVSIIRSNNYLEPSKCLGEYDAVTLTVFYLKILDDMVSQNS